MAKRTTSGTSGRSTAGRAGKAAGGKKGGKRSSRSTSTASASSGKSGIGESLIGFYNRPVVKYVAGGVGLFVLGRIAMNFSGRYPAITTFVRDNLDVIESKLSEFRGNSSDENIADVGDEARH